MRAFSPHLLVAVASLTLSLAGCATPPPASDPAAVADFKETNDPLEPTNRVFYAINNGLDAVILRPLALAYRYGVPQTVRNHTHNVLMNLGNPVTLANDMLEGNPRRAGDTLMRLVVNTTVGVIGVFDVATDMGWPSHDADGGITLAVWGVSEGPFLFLPILGPSSPRDAAGFGMDIVLDPTTWVGRGDVVSALGYAKIGLGAIDARERVLDDLDKITKQALDPYATIRSLARQHRQSQIDDARTDAPASVPAWYSVPQTATTPPKKP